LLGRAGILVRAVEFCEERLAVAVNRGPRCAESLPQVVALVLRQPRPIGLVLLPARKDVVEGSGNLLPLCLRRVLGCERLGFDDEGGSLRDGSFDCSLCFLALLFGEFGDGTAESFEPLLERSEVTDRISGSD
jgi:hypothetical protein